MTGACRSRRAWSWTLIAAGGVTIVLAVGPAPAAAGGATATEVGWWMGPVAAAPDAPADGLVVQGGPSSHIAYSAVRFDLAGEATPDALVLEVAPGSASTPNTRLTVCRLTEPFTPVQGGPMEDAPSYDCEGSVDAALSNDGTTYTFAAAALVHDGALAIAILPTAPTDRVVLSAPGDHSLTSADPGAAPPNVGTSPPPSNTFDLPVADPPVGGTPTFPPAAVPAPDVVAVPDAEPPAVTGPGSVDVSASAGEGSWPRALLVLGLLAIAAGLWSAAGAEREDELDAPAALA